MKTSPRSPDEPYTAVYDCIVFKPHTAIPESLGIPCGPSETMFMLIRPGTWLASWAPQFADTELPEPRGPGLWAWVDDGTQVSNDPDTGKADCIVWHGEWRRLHVQEVLDLASGQPPWSPV